MSQNGEKPTSLTTSLTKNLKVKTKKFTFIADSSLAETFEGLNSL